MTAADLGNIAEVPSTHDQVYCISSIHNVYGLDQRRTPCSTYYTIFLSHATACLPCMHSLYSFHSPNASMQWHAGAIALQLHG